MSNDGLIIENMDPSHIYLAVWKIYFDKLPVGQNWQDSFMQVHNWIITTLIAIDDRIRVQSNN